MPIRDKKPLERNFHKWFNKARIKKSNHTSAMMHCWKTLGKRMNCTLLPDFKAKE